MKKATSNKRTRTYISSAETLRQPVVASSVDDYHSFPDDTFQNLSQSSSSLPSLHQLPILANTPPPHTISQGQQEKKTKTENRRPSMQAWARRLNTKQDIFSLHKVSGGIFVVSSTVLLGGMIFGSNQFQEIPTWLAPFDAAFTLSTIVQGLMGINMVLEHRKRDPEVGKTQIEMGFNSILMALYATWESPFCPSILEEHWKVIFGGLILTLVALDLDAAIVDFDKIQHRMTKIGMKQPRTLFEKISHFFCFKIQFLAGSISNLAFLASYATSDIDRGSYLQFIQDGYGLPFASGCDMPLVYFSTILTSVIISYQSLAATLSNKKLLPVDTVTNFISASTLVVLLALVQLLFANDIYGTTM